MAFDIYSAFPAARLTLITRYAKALQAELTMRLGSNFHVTSEFELDPWKAGPLVQARGVGWPPQFRVCLQAENNDATNFFIGLHCDPPTPITSDNTLTLNEASPMTGDEPNDSWPWWFWLAGPQRYLRSAEGLVELFSDNVIDETATVLARLVHAADSFLSQGST